MLKNGENTNSTNNDATFTITSSITSAASSITKSTKARDVYTYCVGAVAVLSIITCVFFTYSRSSQTSNKEQVKDEQSMKPPKGCSIL